MKVWFACIIWFAAYSIQAQQVQCVNLSGKPIPGVHLLWTDAGDSQLYISDSTGTVILKKNTGALQVSALGYKTLYLSLSGNNKNFQIVLEPITYDLNQVVITAQYQPTRIADAVHKMRVIDAKEIAARAAVNLEDILRTELNFRVSRDNTLGSGVSMMGISGENVKILIDGVPVIGRLNGNIDLNQINLNNVERLEIVDGPLAVNYGSNAMAGTINIITKAPDKNRHQAFADIYSESSGHYNISGGGSTAWKDQAIQITGGRNYFDGWNPEDAAFYHQRSGRADASRAQQWNPREQIFGDAKYRLSKTWGNMEVAGAIFDEEIINRGVPNVYGERALDDVYSTLRRDLSAKYQTEISEKWNMHIIAAFNQYERIKNTYAVDLTGVSRTLSDQSSLQDTSTFSAWLSRGSVIGNIRKNMDVQLGYEAEIESASGQRIKDQSGEIGNYAVFATAEWRPLAGVTLKPGIRYAYNTRYNAPFVPSLNALFNMGKNRKLRASYAKGFRAPGLKELSFYFVDINHNIVGSPDLEAETGHHFQLAFDQNPAAETPWGFGISGFYNNIFDMITLAQVTELEYTYINIGEIQTTGVQGSMKYHKKNLKIEAGGVYSGISNELANEHNISKMYFFPEFHSALTYSVPAWKFTISAFYKYNGKQNFYIMDADENIKDSYLNDFHTADISLKKDFWDNKISVSLGSKNLFDVTNIATGVAGNGGAHSGNAGSQPMATGRTFFLRLSFNLQSEVK